MSEDIDAEPPETATDALLYLDFMARYSVGVLPAMAAGIAGVIRGLMRRTEEQAMVIERMEAMTKGESL